MFGRCFVFLFHNVITDEISCHSFVSFPVSVHFKPEPVDLQM